MTFSMTSYFTGGSAADRTIEVYVNGSLKGTYTLAAMGTVYTGTVTANEPGLVEIEFRSTGSRQVVIDDVSWTCAGTLPTISVSATSLYLHLRTFLVLVHLPSSHSRLKDRTCPPTLPFHFQQITRFLWVIHHSHQKCLP